MAEPITGINITEGKFGAGKTTRNAYLILQALSRDTNTFVFTNIKMLFDHPRLHYFQETYYTDQFDEKTKKTKKIKNYGLLDILRFVGKIVQENAKNKIARKDRPYFVIVEDEAGITYNQEDRNKLPLEFRDYLLQLRKLNVALWIIAQKFKNIAMPLRQHYARVYYTRSLFGLGSDSLTNSYGIRPFTHYPLNGFLEIRRKQVEIDTGQIEVEQYREKNDEGKRTIVDYPIRQKVRTIWKPALWKKYDDLHLNKAFEDYSRDYFFPKFDNIFKPIQLAIPPLNFISKGTDDDNSILHK